MDEVPYTGPEKRQYKRVAETVPVRFKLITDGDKTTPPYRGITKDISGGGIFLKIPLLVEKEMLSVGDRLELEIELPTAPKTAEITGEVVRFVVEIIDADGEVRWVEAKKPQQVYKIGTGIKFIKVSDEDRNRIVNFVEAKLRGSQ